MRTLEALLLLADLLALCSVALARLGRRRGLAWLPAAAVLLAVAQALVEGPRGPLLPAYGLAAGLGLVGWWQRKGSARARAGPTVRHRRAAALAIAGGALIWVVAVVLPWAAPVFQVPLPTGPHAIGTLTYHWTDASRPEVFATDPGRRRQLMAQVWYPAQANAAAPRARYLPNADVVMASFARIHGQPAWVFSQFKYASTPAMPGAAAAADPGPHPVLLFLEGATGFRQMNSVQVLHLVSHGYVVVALDQPGAAAAVLFPDGHQIDSPPLAQVRAIVGSSYLPGGALDEASVIPYLAQDVAFALDRLADLNQGDPGQILTGRLDLRRVGIFGVSLGGIVAAEACRLDARLRACLLMDAPVPTEVARAGLHQPTLWLTRDAASMRRERQAVGGWPEAEIEAHQRSMRAAFERGSGARYLVQLPGAFHANFTDAPIWTPLAPLLGLTGPIGGQRAHAIVNACSLAFFDQHLRGRPARWPIPPASPTADWLFEARNLDPVPTATAP